MRGVKAHVLLDHDDYMPSFVLITEAQRHLELINSFLRNPANIPRATSRCISRPWSFGSSEQPTDFFLVEVSGLASCVRRFGISFFVDDHSLGRLWQTYALYRIRPFEDEHFLNGGAEYRR